LSEPRRFIFGRPFAPTLAVLVPDKYNLVLSKMPSRNAQQGRGGAFGTRAEGRGLGGRRAAGRELDDPPIRADSSMLMCPRA